MSPVVLLHCSGSSGGQWRALAAQFGASHHVVAPDLIGYGASAPWRGGEFSLVREAAAVRTLLGRLGEPAHLVGHSYGGTVALHIARTRPELLASLTLIEPSAFHLLRNGNAIDTAALREIMAVAADASAALAACDCDGGFGRFVDYWSGPGSWIGMPPEKRAAFAPLLAKVALDFHAIFSEPAGLEDVRDMALPTLLLQGGSTKLPSRRVCARLREALPEAAFRLIEGAGHMLPMTHRDEVNRHVVAHIEDNETSTGRVKWKAFREANATQSA